MTLLVKGPDCARRLGMSNSMFYTMTRDGRLPAPIRFTARGEGWWFWPHIVIYLHRRSVSVNKGFADDPIAQKVFEESIYGFDADAADAVQEVA